MKEANLVNVSRHQRRWGRRLAYAAVFILGLLFCVWRAIVWYAERTTPFAGALLPTCGAMVSDEYAKAAEQARSQIQAMMSERQIPGLSVCVAVAGKTVWSEGFGYADRERQTQACPSTQFRIASISKTLTAAAMARLYEQGRLDLDAPVQKYVPGFPDKGQTRPSPRGDLSCKLPSGGFISTAEDLARFGSAHIPSLDRGFLKSETLEMLFDPRTRQGGVLEHGMGWMTARDLRLRRAHFHFGAGSGATSVLAIFPNERLTIAILANLGHAKFPFARLMGVINPFLN